MAKRKKQVSLKAQGLTNPNSPPALQEDACDFDAPKTWTKRVLWKRGGAKYAAASERVYRLQFTPTGGARKYQVQIAKGITKTANGRRGYKWISLSRFFGPKGIKKVQTSQFTLLNQKLTVPDYLSKVSKRRIDPESDSDSSDGEESGGEQSDGEESGDAAESPCASCGLNKLTPRNPFYDCGTCGESVCLHCLDIPEPKADKLDDAKKLQCPRCQRANQEDEEEDEDEGMQVEEQSLECGGCHDGDMQHFRAVIAWIKDRNLQKTWTEILDSYETESEFVCPGCHDEETDLLKDVCVERELPEPDCEDTCTVAKAWREIERMWNRNQQPIVASSPPPQQSPQKAAKLVEYEKNRESRIEVCNQELQKLGIPAAKEGLKQWNENPADKRKSKKADKRKSKKPIKSDNPDPDWDSDAESSSGSEEESEVKPRQETDGKRKRNPPSQLLHPCMFDILLAYHLGRENKAPDWHISVRTGLGVIPIKKLLGAVYGHATKGWDAEDAEVAELAELAELAPLIASGESIICNEPELWKAFSSPARVVEKDQRLVDLLDELKSLLRAAERLDDTLTCQGEQLVVRDVLMLLGQWVNPDTRTPGIDMMQMGAMVSTPDGVNLDVGWTMQWIRNTVDAMQAKLNTCSSSGVLQRACFKMPWFPRAFGRLPDLELAECNPHIVQCILPILHSLITFVVRVGKEEFRFDISTLGEAIGCILDLMCPSCPVGWDRIDEPITDYTAIEGEYDLKIAKSIEWQVFGADALSHIGWSSIKTYNPPTPSKVVSDLLKAVVDCLEFMAERMTRVLNDLIKRPVVSSGGLMAHFKKLFGVPDIYLEHKYLGIPCITLAVDVLVGNNPTPEQEMHRENTRKARDRYKDHQAPAAAPAAPAAPAALKDPAEDASSSSSSSRSSSSAITDDEHN